MQLQNRLGCLLAVELGLLSSRILVHITGHSLRELGLEGGVRLLERPSHFPGLIGSLELLDHFTACVSPLQLAACSV